MTDDSRAAVEGPCGSVPAELADAVGPATARVLGEGAELGDGQRDAILAALTTDTLAVLPPAAGKTAIYAITGAVLGGRTVVVSPTLALHRDQVAHLRDAGLVAEALNSELDAGRRATVLTAFAAGEVEVLVTSPEQLARPDVLTRLAAGAPTLLAIDEVHCVSDWGPDFRPDYLALAPAARALGSPRVLGLTATASVPSREEILDLLDIPDACVVVRDVDRPATHLTVNLVHDEDAKWDQAVDRVARLREESGPAGIVYVTTRGHTDLLARRLTEAGTPAQAYHGGLRKAERASVQDAFMTGGLDVVVATSAFGMGIDKPDVRWVLHADVPTSIDAYHQEIGRAGRDGGRARAVLLHRPQDSSARSCSRRGATRGRRPSPPSSRRSACTPTTAWRRPSSPTRRACRRRRSRGRCRRWWSGARCARCRDVGWRPGRTGSRRGSSPRPPPASWSAAASASAARSSSSVASRRAGAAAGARCSRCSASPGSTPAGTATTVIPATSATPGSGPGRPTGSRHRARPWPTRSGDAVWSRRWRATPWSCSSTTRDIARCRCRWSASAVS